MRILFCDKDDTLVESISGNKFIQGAEDQRLIDGVKEKLEQYRQAGWEIAIATNQGGVASGYKTIDEAIRETEFAMRLAGINHAMLAHSYESRHGGEAWYLRIHFNGAVESQLVRMQSMKFRKPGSGMIDWQKWKIAKGYPDPNGTEVLMVGDRPEDEACAQAAGAKFNETKNWLYAPIGQGSSVRKVGL